MAEIKKISTELQLLDKFLDTSGDAGASGQVLTSTGTGINWVSAGTPGSGIYLPLSAGSGERVTGDLYISDKLYMRPSATYGSGYKVMTATGTASAPYTSTLSFSNYSQSDVMVLKGSNVGIGTTLPDKQLTFGQADDDAIQIRRLTTSEGQNAVGSGISWTWSNSSTNTQTWAAIRAIMPGSGNTHITFSTRTSAATFGEKMRIKDNGNVGIGTSDPASKLTVGGNATGFSTAMQVWQNGETASSGDIGGKAATFFGQSGVSNSSIVNIYSTNAYTGQNGGEIGFGGKYSSGGNVAQFAKIRSFKTNNSNGGVNYGGGMEFWTRPNSSSAVPRMTILGDGKIGIGTTNPLANLDITNNIGGIYQQWSYDNPGSNNYNLQLTETVTSGNVRFVFDQKNAGTQYSDVLVFNKGKIGINTDEPSYKLDVNGDIRARENIRVFGNSLSSIPYNTPSETSVNLGTYINDYAYIDVASSNAGGGWIDFSKANSGDYAGRIRYVNSTDQFQISTNNSQKMVIESGGDVGIGTTSPDTRLDVRITTSNRTTLEPVLTVSAQGNGPYTGFGPKISFNSNIYYSATTAGNIETAYIGAVMGPTYETYSDLVFGTRQNATTVDEKMRITGGGYVGIGGVPKAWLHINKSQSYGSLRISPTSNNGESAMAFFTDAAGTQTSTAWVVGHAGWANTGDFVIGNQAFGGPIMLIQQDGNTGIGSTSPGAKLDVVGNVRTSTYYNFHGNPAVPTDTTAAIFDQTSIGPTISGLNVTFRAGTPTPAEVMRIDDSGNVGIGTTSPGYKLEVDGTGLFTGVLVLKGQASNYDATTGRTAYWAYDDKVALALEPAANDGAVAIFFKSIGNAPSDFGYIAFDEDYGEDGVTAGENCALVIGCENDGGGSSDHVRVKGRLVVEADMSSSDPTKAFQVKASNTTSDLFHINRAGGGYLSGTLNVTGDVVAYYSDMRLKTKLEDLTGAVSKIKMLNSFYYEPNEKALELGYKKERRIGLSAQEVQEVLPEAVSKASISHDPKVEEDYLSVDYAKLVPLLVEGIKELKAEIEELKKQIK